MLLEITAAQLVAHGVGDYIFQSDWMASDKTKSWKPALAHATSYTLPFLFLSLHWQALAFICVTHFVIDHWRLARYVCWAKNHLAPKLPWKVSTDTEGYAGVGHYLPWEHCQGTGYDPSKPAWLSVWLLIIADNLMHVLCNAFALTYL